MARKQPPTDLFEDEDAVYGFLEEGRETWKRLLRAESAQEAWRGVRLLDYSRLRGVVMAVLWLNRQRPHEDSRYFDAWFRDDPWAEEHSDPET